MIAAAEFELTSASRACEAQNAEAVHTVRHAPLKKICTGFGRCSGLQSDWTSAPPRPIRTDSLKLIWFTARRMKPYFGNILLLSPKRGDAIAESPIPCVRTPTQRRNGPGLHH